MTQAEMPPFSLLISFWMIGAFLMAAKRFAEYRFIGNSATASGGAVAISGGAINLSTILIQSNSAAARFDDGTRTVGGTSYESESAAASSASASCKRRAAQGPIACVCAKR